jgi:AraC family transcriptional regulator, regulatory protein of adaptative response / DNA-3-methyladenine glycosylase II
LRFEKTGQGVKTYINILEKKIMNKKDKVHITKFLLKYKKPFDFRQMLSFMKPRAMEGLELVTDHSYARTFRIHGTKGFFIVKNKSEQSALELKIGCCDKKFYIEIHNKVRRMFDLDTDFTNINQKFSKDKRLLKGMDNGHAPRLPIAFQPFEFVVRAVLGQQISVKAATTLAARVARKAQLKTGNDFPSGLDYFFPDPSELLKLELDGLGITKTRQTTIKTVTRGILDKRFSLTDNQDFETFQKDFSVLKGIGDWTVNYVAMRGLGMIDSFPVSDLGIIRSLTRNEDKPSKKQIMDMAEKWRPYRAYATLCLWNYEKK